MSSGAGPDGDAGGGGGRPTHWEGEPVPVLERLWDVPRLEVHERLGSTNERLAGLARDGAPTWTVVLAEEQTAGRGREGRVWHSPPGVGLWMSVLLPGGPEGRPPLGPILVGVAAARTLGRWGIEARLKWPNDLYVGGRKVGGVLCRSGAGARTVAGIGVNVLQEREDFPPELRERAGSLASEAGARVSRLELAGGLLTELRRLFAGGVPERLEGELARELRELDLLRGTRVEASGGVRGRAAGVAPDGALRIEGSDGAEARVVAGSVRRIDDGDGA